MEPMSREYLGGAAVARLTQPLGGTDGDRVLVVSTMAGWTFGPGALFGVSVNRGKPTEEKVVCTVGSRNPDGSGTLTVYVEPAGSPNAGHVYRGWDDTTIQSHPVDATVEHVWTATDATEVKKLLADQQKADQDTAARFNGTWRSLLAPVPTTVNTPTTTTP